MRSVVRTVELCRSTFSASKRCSSCAFNPRSALAWPTDNKPWMTQVCTCGIEVEETHRVGDRRAALPDLLRDLFLAHPEFSREPGVSLRFFNRIQLRSLEIFDQRQLENFEVGRLPNDNRRFRQTDLLGRAPAAFARDQLKLAFSWPNDKRLNDSALPDGLDQLGERFAFKFASRLQWARDNGGEADLLHLFAGFAARERGARARH